MRRVAIIAAMPGELLHLARGWKHEKRDGGVHIWRMTQENVECVAACAGAGQAAATRAFAEVERDGPVSAAISTGWAGALTPEYVAGRVYAVAGVIDAKTGERFEAGDAVLANGGLPQAPSSWRTPAGARARGNAANGVAPGGRGEGLPSGAETPADFRRASGTAEQAAEKPSSEGGGGFSPRIHSAKSVGFSPGPSLQRPPSPAICSPPAASDALIRQSKPWVVTNAKVAGTEEKRRLAAAYPAGLVDMEAAAVARLAAMRGIQLLCIKGVSDGHSARLPDFNRFLTPEGQFQLARFIFFAILRPWHWPELMRMSENSSKASQALRDSLLENLRRTGAD